MNGNPKPWEDEDVMWQENWEDNSDKGAEESWREWSYGGDYSAEDGGGPWQHPLEYSVRMLRAVGLWRPTIVIWPKGGRPRITIFCGYAFVNMVIFWLFLFSLTLNIKDCLDDMGELTDTFMMVAVTMNNAAKLAPLVLRRRRVERTLRLLRASLRLGPPLEIRSRTVESFRKQVQRLTGIMSTAAMTILIVWLVFPLLPNLVQQAKHAGTNAFSKIPRKMPDSRVDINDTNENVQDMIVGTNSITVHRTHETSRLTADNSARKYIQSKSAHDSGLSYLVNTESTPILHGDDVGHTSGEDYQKETHYVNEASPANVPKFSDNRELSKQIRQSNSFADESTQDIDVNSRPAPNNSPIIPSGSDNLSKDIKVASTVTNSGESSKINTNYHGIMEITQNRSNYGINLKDNISDISNDKLKTFNASLNDGIMSNLENVDNNSIPRQEMLSKFLGEVSYYKQESAQVEDKPMDVRELHISDNLNSTERSEHKIRLPFATWFPLDVQRTRNYYIAYIFQILGSFLDACWSVTMNCFYAALLHGGCVSLRLLHESLKQLSPTTKPPPKQRLALCAQQHNAILSFVREVDVLLGPVMFIESLNMIILLCSVVFHATTLSAGNPKLLSTLGFLLYEMLELLLFCYFGTELKYESEKVIDAAYSGEWYATTSTERKELNFLMLRSSRPCVINNCGFSRLSLDLFSALLRSSYSLFAVLQQTNDDPVGH